VQRHLELELPSQNGSDLIGGGVAGQSGAGIERPTLSATKSTKEPCSSDRALACGRSRSRGRYERAAHQRVASKVLPQEPRVFSRELQAVERVILAASATAIFAASAALFRIRSMLTCRLAPWVCSRKYPSRNGVTPLPVILLSCNAFRAAARVASCSSRATRWVSSRRQWWPT